MNKSLKSMLVLVSSLTLAFVLTVPALASTTRGVSKGISEQKNEKIVNFAYEDEITTYCDSLAKGTSGKIIEEKRKVPKGYSENNKNENKKSEKKGSVEIPKKESNEFLKPSGLNRGYNQMRMELGIVIPEGAKLEIKIKNSDEFSDELKLDLITDDRSKDLIGQIIPKDGESLKITAKTTSVPFIDFHEKSGVKNPVVEYTVSSAKNLPRYEYKGNVDNFFKNWSNEESEFALITSKQMKILVPIIDMEDFKDVSKVGEFSSIDEMLESYNKVIDTYDKVSGLSENTNVDTDKNILNQFFIRTDKTSERVAYYSPSWIGVSGNSLSEILLKKNISFEMLHEIAHGYDGNIVSLNPDLDFPLTEVWNNIFADYYQFMNMSTANYLENSWLYDGDREAFENKMVEAKKNNTPYKDLDYKQKLYPISMLYQITYKEETLTKFLQKYRKNSLENTVNLHYSAFDIITEYIGETENLNLIPYFEAYGIYINDTVKSTIYSKNYDEVFIFADLFDDTEKAKKVSYNIGLNSIYSPITTRDLSDEEIYGKLCLELNNEAIKMLENATLILKSGDKIIKSIVVDESGVLDFGDVLIGMYTIEIPSRKIGLENMYEVKSSQSVLVKEDYENKIKLETTKLSTPNKNESLIFRGLGNMVYANLKIDVDNREIIFNKTSSAPNPYLSKEKYLDIQVLSRDGKTNYKYSANGNDETQIQNEIIKYEYGDKLVVTLSEPTRLLHRLDSTHSGTQEYIKTDLGEDKMVENIFTLSEYGLSDPLQKDEKEMHLFRIDELAKYITSVVPSNEISNPYHLAKKRNLLLDMINMIKDESIKKEYYEKYDKIHMMEDIPKITSLSESILDINEPKTEEEFLNSINCATENAIRIESNFEKQVSFDEPNDYEIAIFAFDARGSKSEEQKIKLLIKDMSKPVLSGTKKIIYEREDEIKTDAEKFLSDINAQLDESGTIETDFKTSVNMRKSGQYKATVSATNDEGISADDIHIDVTIEDTTPPVLTVKEESITYIQDENISEKDFLLNIGASIDEEGEIKSDFDEKVDFETAEDYVVLVFGEDESKNESNKISINVKIKRGNIFSLNSSIFGSSNDGNSSSNEQSKPSENKENIPKNEREALTKERKKFAPTGEAPNKLKNYIEKATGSTLKNEENKDISSSSNVSKDDLKKDKSENQKDVSNSSDVNNNADIKDKKYNRNNAKMSKIIVPVVLGACGVGAVAALIGVIIKRRK